MKRICRKKKWLVWMERAAGVHIPRRRTRIPRGRLGGRRRRNAEQMGVVGAFFVLALLLLLLLIRGGMGILAGVKIDVQDIQAMRISSAELSSIAELCAEEGRDLAETLTAYCIEHRFFPEKQTPRTKEQIRADFLPRMEEINTRIGEKQRQQYFAIVEAMLGELESFPVSRAFYRTEYTFGDTWGARSIGCGAKLHEGVDIFDRENLPGRLPVVAMASGTIEAKEVGENGACKLTLRTERGNRHYYSGLYGIESAIDVGAAVSAGMTLGYIGATEGAKNPAGDDPANIHLGVWLKTDLAKEGLWVNPYPFLRYLEAQED